VELRWLETFAVAAREGSMSAAAEVLGYARSTVTGHVQSLERSLGAELFDRRTAGHPLTMSGVALLQHAENILAEVRRARAAVVEAEEGRAPSLTLGATDSVASYRLPLFLRMLSRFVPELRVEVEAAGAKRLREQVVSGHPQVVLVNGERSETQGELSAKVVRRVLWEEEIVLVGTTSAATRPKRVLLTGPDCVYREVTERDVLPRLPGVDVMQVGHVEGVKSAVIAGLGVGLLPLVAVKPWLVNGQLQQLTVRTDRRVITEVVWNLDTCPVLVSEHLRLLRPVRADVLG
jgi:DNA-binding transcriptional LysR family regulator